MPSCTLLASASCMPTACRAAPSDPTTTLEHSLCTTVWPETLAGFSTVTFLLSSIGLLFARSFGRGKCLLSGLSVVRNHASPCVSVIRLPGWHVLAETAPRSPELTVVWQTGQSPTRAVRTLPLTLPGNDKVLFFCFRVSRAVLSFRTICYVPLFVPVYSLFWFQFFRTFFVLPILINQWTVSCIMLLKCGHC